MRIWIFDRNFWSLVELQWELGFMNIVLEFRESAGNGIDILDFVYYVHAFQWEFWNFGEIDCMLGSYI